MNPVILSIFSLLTVPSAQGNGLEKRSFTQPLQPEKKSLPTPSSAYMNSSVTISNPNSDETDPVKKATKYTDIMESAGIREIFSASTVNKPLTDMISSTTPGDPEDYEFVSNSSPNVVSDQSTKARMDLPKNTIQVSHTLAGVVRDVVLPPIHNIHSTNAFKMWEQWGSLYHSCSETNNKQQSPIDIQTALALHDKSTQTLFVYSSSPITDYVLSLHHTFRGMHISIDVVTLKLGQEKFHEATYISGLGDDSYRFFESAIFLFTRNQSVNPRLSLHKIDGKQFQMEIVLNFKKQCELDFCNHDETHVHVMVEIGEMENPLFKPLVDALITIEHGYHNINETVNVAQDLESEIENLYDKYNVLSQRWKTNGFEKMSKILPALVKNVEKNLAEIKIREAEVTQLAERIRSLMEKIGLYREEFEAKKKKRQEIMNCTLEVTAMFQNCSHSECSNSLKPLIDGYQQEILKYDSTITEIMLNMYTTEVSANITDSKKRAIQRKIERLKKTNSVQLKRQGFTTDKEAVQRLKELSETTSQLEEYKIKMHQKIQEHRELMKAIKPEAQVDIFQASWLLPSIGGHYRYNGSNPLPPCEESSYTIVMEKPLVISSSQLEAFASVTNARRTESLGDTLPVIHEVNDRQVFFNKKNLQFILDDDVHMKSKFRKKLKDAAKAGCRRNADNFLVLNVLIVVSMRLISAVFCR